MNYIAGYRVMLGKTQQEMGEMLNISKQSYYLKENGKVAFTDDEKVRFTEIINEKMPDVTLLDIFFTNKSKKYKENIVI